MTNDRWVKINPRLAFIWLLSFQTILSEALKAILLQNTNTTSSDIIAGDGREWFMHAAQKDVIF